MVLKDKLLWIYETNLITNHLMSDLLEIYSLLYFFIILQCGIVLVFLACVRNVDPSISSPICSS